MQNTELKYFLVNQLKFKQNVFEQRISLYPKQLCRFQKTTNYKQYSCLRKDIKKKMYLKSWCARRRALFFHLLHHVHTLEDVPENYVLSVEPGSKRNLGFRIESHSTNNIRWHQSVLTVVKKNCEQLVFWPRLLIDKIPDPECFI